MIGTKHTAEAADSVRSGRGAFHGGRRRVVRRVGRHGSENAGISNEKRSGKLLRRKSKVFWAMLIIPELVGP